MDEGYNCVDVSVLVQYGLKTNCCNCCVRSGWSAKVIDSYYEMYVSSKTNKDQSKIQEMSAKLTETTNQHMKINKENIPDCICIVKNINDKHWILVFVCYIRTLNGDYIDVNIDNWLYKVENESYSNTFEKYPLPCFLILDSMGGNGTIHPDTERLIQALRHWLTNQSDLNKTDTNLMKSICHIHC